MTGPLLEALASFEGLRAVVVGDAMLDVYLHGRTGRLCPEAPVPVVAVGAGVAAPGGAANAAVNLRALGAEVTLASVVGDDAEGGRLLELLAGRGVDAAATIVRPGRGTLTKTRVLAEDHLLLRIDAGDVTPILGGDQRALRERLKDLVAGADLVLVSDYGYGVLTSGVIAALPGIGPLVAVDAKDLAAYRALGPTVVKPNFAQAARMLGGAPAEDDPEARAAWVLAQGERLLDATAARIAAVTLDADGAVVLERDRPPYRTYARPRGQTRAAGAGDTFLAAMSLALAAGAGTAGASELASAAAGVVMGKDGTAVCTTTELRTCLSGAAGKVLQPSELTARLAFARSQGRRIVFTNGCFDLLHRGHVTYLTRAKALGEVLVLGVNSDRSVRELKGPGRPVTPLGDRIEVLAALSCVDHVVAFDEPTPIELVRRVRPDVFVKGGDYTREMLPEAAVVEALGGSVQILPYVDDRSTTGIIHRIRSAEPSQVA